MKFNFHTIVFDLETTDDEKSRSIIEIGATLLDKELNIVDHYSSLVFPANIVSDYVIKLTGILREELKEARSFIDVAEEFENWVTIRNKLNIKNCRLAAWGNYFDINVLRKEYWGYERNFPFSGTCVDVKTVALTYLALSGQRTDSCSVANAAKILDIKPCGSYHRALTDADATAKIYIEMLKRIKNGVWIDKQYIKIGV